MKYLISSKITQQCDEEIYELHLVFQTKFSENIFIP